MALFTRGSLQMQLQRDAQGRAFLRQSGRSTGKNAFKYLRVEIIIYQQQLFTCLETLAWGTQSLTLALQLPSLLIFL